MSTYDIKLPNKVEDIYGDIIYLDGEPLGKGGQGIVCRTKDKNIAIKFLVNDESIVVDEQAYESYKNKINEISILKIDQDINIRKLASLTLSQVCIYLYLDLFLV